MPFGAFKSTFTGIFVIVKVIHWSRFSIVFYFCPAFGANTLLLFFCCHDYFLSVSTLKVSSSSSSCITTIIIFISICGTDIAHLVSRYSMPIIKPMNTIYVFFILPFLQVRPYISCNFCIGWPLLYVRVER